MSFAELFDKFDVVAQHLKEGLRAISVLSTFLKAYKRQLESFASSLHKHGITLQGNLPKESGVDTLNTALTALPLSVQKVSAQYDAYSQSLQMEVVEPLDLFYDHFTTTNQVLISTGSQAFSLLVKTREALSKAKEKYHECNQQKDKAEKMMVMADDEKLDKARKQFQSFSAAAKAASERYLQAVTDYNSALAEYERKYPKVMEGLQQSEESRIHFLKYTLEKFMRLQQRLNQVSGDLFGDMGAIIGNINSPIDIRVFVDGNKSTIPSFQRATFVPYQSVSGLESAATALSTPEDTASVLQEVLGVVLTESTEPPAKLMQVIDMLKSSRGRNEFLEQLDKRQGPRVIAEKCLVQLSDLFTVLLTEVQMSNDRDCGVFYKSLVLIQTYGSEMEGSHRYLSSLLAHHRLWSDHSRWVETVMWAVSARVAIERQSLRKRQRSAGLFGTLKTIAGRLPQKDLARAEQTSAFHVLSQFNFHMINLGLGMDAASEVVLEGCRRLGLDCERTCVLLAELQANQRCVKKVEEHPRDAVRKSLKHRKGEQELWGDWLPYALAAAFLPDSSHLSLILVSKRWSEVMSRHLLTLRLHHCSFDRLASHRSSLWQCLLTRHTTAPDYSALLWRVQTGEVLSKDLEEVISMDVQRSYQSLTHVASETLANLLRTYAFYNPDIAYCQGMNYLAGTLLIQLQDEGLAFRCFVGLIERYNMHSLLVSNLPRLKLFFYQLDRLVGILLPSVHEVFKEEMVSSSHFAAPWFLTLFASLYQGSTSRVGVLFRLWDFFLLVRIKQEGWKFVFKTAIAILTVLEAEIVARKFEDIMGLLTGLGGHEASRALFDPSFVLKAQSVRVTGSLLQDLESEYEHLKLRAASIYS